jgi:HK97 family phage major capsid protein
MSTNTNAAKRTALLDAQTLILNQAQASGRKLTASEEQRFATMSIEVKNLIAQPSSDIYIPGSGRSTQPVISAAYSSAFWQSVQTRNFTNAALGESGTAADGSYLVPTETDPTIPNLAVIEAAARKLSLVVETSMDLKLPYQSAKTVATAKAESNNSSTNAFGTSVPQFNTTTLSAYMAGDAVSVSWELLQDSKALATFVTEDLNRAVYNYEENKFINGSGTGEPLGYLNGVTAANTAALSTNAVLDLTGYLKQAYYSNASFLMSRQTLIALIKAQVAASQFQTFVTWEANGTARLFGYPVQFSSQMPTYQASPGVNGCILFGDFKAGWVIGDRGGSSIRAKVLDQVSALNGVTVILAYRRTDQRVRIAEAVQAFTVVTS